MTVLGKDDNEDRDWKIEHVGGSYTVTDVSSGSSSELKMDNFEFEHNSLISMDLAHGKEVIQFVGQQHDLKFDFYYKGGQVNTMIYDETQYKYKQHMAPPIKVDHSRSILSPMPGAIVSVNVEVGQTVVDGQDLCIVEAMKM